MAAMTRLWANLHNGGMPPTRPEDPPLDVGRPGIVLTKLYPPRTRPETVRRVGLLGRLDDAGNRRLVVVAAPAGYGKTTLLADWASDRSDDAPVAWVSIDERDDDPVVLWSHIFTALVRTYPDLTTAITPEAIVPRMLKDAVLARLVNDLTGGPAVTLVLDDFHRISGAESIDAVAWFLEHAPDNVQVVIGTRTDPRLPLGALRAHGHLGEIRIDALRFSPDETAMLLNDRLGLDLGPDEMRTLVDRTEGWPAGLYLAALAMSGARDRGDLIRRFGGSNRHVIDFLVDEVLDRFDPGTQDFMVRTSVVEKLCGSLCDSLLQRTGSADLLSMLARSNLFLIPLDDRGEWYRFHHMFAELLTVELHRRAPQDVPILHSHASSWYRERGIIDDAVRHALDAGDLDTAIAIIEASWIDIANASRYQTVQGWIRRLPRDVVDARSRLLLVEAWVASFCAERHVATRAIARIESAADLTDGPLTDGFASVESSLETLKAIFPWGDATAEVLHGRTACDLEPVGSRWRPVAEYAVGLGRYFQGDAVEASHSLTVAREGALAYGQWLIVGSCLGYESLAAGDLSRPEEQRRLAEEGSAFAAEWGMEDVAGEIHVAMATWLASHGKYAEALPLAERGLRVLRAWGQPLEIVEALLRLAPILQALGAHERAAEACTEARDVIAACTDPGALPIRLASIHVQRSRAPRAGEPLTDREISVLRMLGSDRTQREIGASLFVSINTVHTQVRAIYRKLGATSRDQAVRIGRDRGVI